MRSLLVLALTLISLIPFQNCSRTGFSGNGGGYEGAKTDGPTDYVNAGGMVCGDAKPANLIRMAHSSFTQLRKDCVSSSDVVDPIISHESATPAALVYQDKLYRPETGTVGIPKDPMEVDLFCRGSSNANDLMEVEMWGGAGMMFTNSRSFYRDNLGPDQTATSNVSASVAGNAQISYADANSTWVMSLDTQSLSASIQTSIFNTPYSANLTCYTP